MMEIYSMVKGLSIVSKPFTAYHLPQSGIKTGIKGVKTWMSGTSWLQNVVILQTRKEKAFCMFRSLLHNHCFHFPGPKGKVNGEIKPFHPFIKKIKGVVYGSLYF